MKIQKLPQKSHATKLLKNILLGTAGIFSAASLSAAPIVNNFANLNDLTAYSDSVSFDNSSGAGPLEVTVVGEGAFNKGIFRWAWLSLDKTQEQFVFALTGAASTGTPAAKIVSIEFNVGGVGTVVINDPVIVGGNYSFDVYEAVSTQFYGGGAVPTDRSYYTQFYLAPIAGGSPAGVVYEFDSFSATAVPEPTTGVLTGIALMALCFHQWKRKSGIRRATEMTT